MSEKTGRAKEIVGWATGDRDVEAKGRVEQQVADPTDDSGEVTDDAIADESLKVRKDHKEMRPGAG